MLKRGWLALAGLGLFLSFQVSATKYVPIGVGDIMIIIPVNEPPEVVTDYTYINEIVDICDAQSVEVTNAACNKYIDVLANDIEPDGQALTLVSVSGASHASTLEIDATTSTVRYIPATSFYEQGNNGDSFTYIVQDSDGNQVTGQVAISLNRAPIVSNEDYYIVPIPGVCDHTVSTLQNCSVYSINPTDNDYDPEGDDLVKVYDFIRRNEDLPNLQISPPDIGAYYDAASDLETGYWPDICFFGSTVDSNGNACWLRNLSRIFYRVKDARGAISRSARIYVRYNQDIPIATNDTYSIQEDTATELNVLANDSDSLRQGLTITNVTSTSLGTVTIQQDNTLLYEPHNNLHGFDSFSYTIQEADGDTATATVNITIIPVNDAPVIGDFDVVLDEDSKVIIEALSNVTDVDSDFSYVKDSVTEPSRGTLTVTGNVFTYEPFENTHGFDSFKYSISDGEFIAEATVSITINAVNDAPAISGSPASVATAFSDYSFTPVVTDIDTPAGNLTFSIANKPDWASFNTSTGQLSGKPYPQHAGDYTSIRITVSDGEKATTLAPFSIGVMDTPLVTGLSVTQGPVVKRQDTTLSWTAISEPEATYKIFYTQNETHPKLTEAGTQAPEGTTSRTVALGSEGTYHFYVAVCGPNRTFCSKQYSDPVSIDVVSGLNLVPGNLSVDKTEILKAEQFTLSWDAPALAPTGIQYVLEIKYPGAGTTYLPKTEDGFFASNERSSIRQAFSTFGEFRYRVLACDKTHTWLGQSVIDAGAYYDGCGQPGNTVSVVVTDINKAPKVTPDAELAGKVFMDHETVEVSAAATDSDGTIQSVSFSLDGNTWQNGTYHAVTSNYKYDFGTLAKGNYVLYVKATDDDGDESVQHEIDFMIDSKPPLPAENKEFPGIPEAVTLNKYTEDTTSSVVGMTAGQFRVDESGAATYQIPLSLPGGIAGVTPELSLSYSSSGGNGPMGIGWSISGLSSISRCRQTYEQDGSNKPLDFSDTDRFCLDGQKLVLVNASTREYRTEIGGRVRIKAHGTAGNGPAYFTVEREDGSVSYYGNQDVANNPRVNAVITNDEDILIWNLVSISDNIAKSDPNANNHIFFHYHDYAEAENDFEVVLSSIEYSGNDIVFNYLEDSRLDVSTGFLMGTFVESTVQLESVEVFDHQVSANLLRRYNIVYEEDAVTRFKRVSTITECTETDLGQEICYPPTSFSWNNGQEMTVANYIAKHTVELANEVVQVLPVDLTGDGITDLVSVVKTGNTEYQVYVNENQGTLLSTTETELFTITNNQSEDHPVKVLPADINGDGKTDLMFYSGTGENIAWYYYDGVSSAPVSLSILVDDTTDDIRLHDINADAYPDLMYRIEGNNKLAINNRVGGFEAAQNIKFVTEGIEIARYLSGTGTSGFSADANAELIDRLPFDVAIEKYQNRFNNNADKDNTLSLTGSDTTNLNYPGLCNFDNICRDYNGSGIDTIPTNLPVLDFNGDGRADLVVRMMDIYDVNDGLREWTEKDIYWMAFNLVPVGNTYEYQPIAALTQDRSGPLEALDEHAIIADFNSDGLADVMRIIDHNSVGSIWLSSGISSIGSTHKTVKLGASYTDMQSLQMVDLNKDGLVDILYFDTVDKAWEKVMQNRVGGFDDAVQFADAPDFDPSINSVFAADWTGDGDIGIARVDYLEKELHYRRDSRTNNVRENAIHTITNGFGLQTSIEYGLMTEPFGDADPDVYTKGSGADSKHWGRCILSNIAENDRDAQCTPVFDIVNPGYVVSAVESDAPGYIAGSYDATNTLRVEYHYEGARAQAGGRGMLGFEKVYTYDPGRNVTTTTEYHQEFPYTGMPKSTLQFVGQRGDVIAENKKLSFSENTYDYDILHADSGNYIQVYFPYLDISEETTYALNDAATATKKLSKIKTDNTYTKVTADKYANLTGILVETFNTSDELVKKVNTVNQYNDETVTSQHWWIGRVTRTEVTHTRNENGSADDVGSQTITRTSEFKYSSTTGLLDQEIVEPDSTNKQVKLTTQHCYNSVGGKVATMTYNDDITPPACNTISATEFEEVTGITPENGLNHVFRMSRTVFDENDDELRYSVAGGNDKFITSTVISRNQYGQVTQASDINGVNSYTWYDSFGAAYASANDVGQASNKIRRLKKDATAIGVPADLGNYHFVEKSITEGGTTNFVYYDIVGREVATAREAFVAGTYIYQLTQYDPYGRVIKQSVPSYDTTGLKYTTTTYDDFGRAQQIITPTSGTTATTSTILYADNGLSTTTSVTFDSKNDAIQTQNKTETKNVLGEARTITDAAGTINYYYNATGNLTKVVGVDNEMVTTTFDDYGRKTGMVDPDKGTWSYQYNALGELVSQTSAKGDTTAFYRDTLGRTVKRIAPGETTLYHFVGHQLDNECLTSVATSTDCSANIVTSKQYFYDSVGRAEMVEHILEGSPYYQKTKYDEYGRVFEEIDATDDFGIHYNYTDHGYLLSQEEARYSGESTGGANKLIFSEVAKMDAFGNVTEFKQNNGKVTTTRVYDSVNGLLTSIQAKDGSNAIIQHNSFTFDDIGNLRTRTRHTLNSSATVSVSGNSMSIQTESFKYDSLNRLTHIKDAAASSFVEHIGYYANGNIKHKRIDGSKQYFCYAGSRPHAVTGLGTAENCTTNSYQYDANGNMTSGRNRTIAYGHFDKATSITNTVDSSNTTFAYDGNRSRYKRETTKDSKVTTWYIGNVEYIFEDGVFQKTRRNLPSAIQIRHDLTGAIETSYLHKDHIGSIDTITNEQAKVTSKLYFDAWGQKEDIDESHWNTTVKAQSTLADVLDLTPRGFTGHEHVDHADIIHMNGRIYDPTLGRFLQADPFIQAPSNSQSYNRYSYLMNRPLSGIDPSGYFGVFKKIGRQIIRGMVKVFGKTLTNIIGNVASLWCGPFYAVCAAGWAYDFNRAMGGSSSQALKGAFTAGISAYIGGNLNTGTAFGNFLAAGVVGGALSHASGGNFGHGFWAAGLNQAIGGADMTSNPVANVAISAVIGGTISKVTGGKFANGAASAAFAAALRQDWSVENISSPQDIQGAQEKSKTHALFVDCNSGNTSACSQLKNIAHEDLKKAYEFIKNHAPELMSKLGGSTSQGNIENTTFDFTDEFWGVDSGQTTPFSGKIILSANYHTLSGLIDTLTHEMIHSGDGFWGRWATKLQDRHFGDPFTGWGTRHTDINNAGIRMAELYKMGKIHN